MFAVPFVLVVRMIDYLEREPPGLQVLAVLWGGIVATSAALNGATAVQNLLAKVGSPAAAARWGPAVTGAAVEEVVKVAGVVAIALVAPRHFNTMVDGFVYGALVGLGFQLVEDMVFALGAVGLDEGVDAVAPVIGTFLVRGVLGGLWSHTLFTALAGAGVAYAITRRDRPAWLRTAMALLLFGAAAGFHFLWNSPILAIEPRFGLLGVAGVVLVKGIPALLVGIALLVAAERREAHYFSGLLAGLGDPRIAGPDEIATLMSPRRRLAARRAARVRLGWHGARAVRRLQRSQAQLAVALARDPGAEVSRRRRDVLSRRHQLLALSLHGQGRTRRGPLLDVAVAVIQAVAAALVLLGLAIAIRDLT
ncbi:MAG: PrsW family intramembrane metalloprotease [Sporichthyaceae bacterium]|nr:PrsW family intramembrane metalloprotease [Sporichthyaceae bacterium]